MRPILVAILLLTSCSEKERDATPVAERVPTASAAPSALAVAPERAVPEARGLGAVIEAPVAWSHDSATLAVVHERGVLLSRRDGAPLRDLATAAPPIAAVFAPKDELVAIRHDAGIDLWHLGRGEKLRTLAYAVTDRELAPLAFSDDGRLLAASNHGEPAPDRPNARVWRVADGAIERDLSEPYRDQLAFAPGGRALLLGSWGLGASLYDLVSGRALGEIAGDTGGTFGTQISPDGRWLAAAATDGHGLRVTRASGGDGKQLATAASCDEHVGGLVFSPGGRAFVAHGGDVWLATWSTSDWRRIAEWRPDLVPGYVEAVSDDGKRVVGSGDSGLWVWDAPSTLRAIPHALASVRLSPDAREIAGVSKGVASVIDLSSGVARSLGARDGRP